MLEVFEGSWGGFSCCFLAFAPSIPEIRFLELTGPRGSAERRHGAMLCLVYDSVVGGRVVMQSLGAKRSA